VVPQWHINAWRVAYWDRFCKPDYTAKQSLGVTDTWWSKDAV
jgi:microcin C transport system substrate-binding protein